jgi:hypothetical protein
MTKLNSLAQARVIGPEGGAEDGAAGAGVGQGATCVDVLVVSSSDKMCQQAPRVLTSTNLARPQKRQYRRPRGWGPQS